METQSSPNANSNNNNPFFHFYKLNERRIPALVSNNQEILNFPCTIIMGIFGELTHPLGDDAGNTLSRDDVTIVEEARRFPYDAIDLCRTGQMSSVALNLDEALTTYIGLDQWVMEPRDNSNPDWPNSWHTNLPSGESSVNERIINLHNDLQTNFVTNESCSPDKNIEKAHRRLHKQENSIVGELAAPPSSTCCIRCPSGK